MAKVVSPLSHREVEAAEVDFEAVSEPWSSYHLSDGTTLKLRTIVNGVIRLEGEHDTMGNPLYSVSHNTVIRVVGVPKQLRGTPTVGGPPAKTTTTGPEIR